MPLNPQRPFIPNSGPSTVSAGSVSSGFRLTRPFIHGAEAISQPTLPTINQFLDDSRQPDDHRQPEDTSFAHSTPQVAAADSAFDYAADRLQDDEDLPPIEHFTDPLPPVGMFTPSAEDRFLQSSSETSSPVVTERPQTATASPEETGWVDTGWQDFDWNGAAALGEATDPDASDEWSRTDWGTAGLPAREFRETAAQAIANALDQIAQRIRKGEIIVPPPDLVNDPAAIAATLAALLGVRR